MSETTANLESLSSITAKPGKYLSFALSSEKYAIDIQKVVEIFGVRNITRVPRCPNYVKGVINLRGRIIPVIDLRLKFELQEKEYDSRTCIIVLNSEIKGNSMTLGIIVDTVLEVQDFNQQSIAAAPNYGVSVKDNFIIGMGKLEAGEVVILLDIDKAFNSDEEAAFVENLSKNS